MFIQQHFASNSCPLQSAWTSEKLLEDGDPALPHEREGGSEMKAKVSIVLGIDNCSDTADAADAAADDVDAAAAAQAQLLLKTGSAVGTKKETLIDRISRRFRTIERTSSNSPAAMMMTPPLSTGTDVFYLQQKQVRHYLVQQLAHCRHRLPDLLPPQALELSPRHIRGRTTGLFPNRTAPAASAIFATNALSDASD
jgi:hypothetical protein